MEVGIALFVVYNDCVNCFWVCTSGKDNQSEFLLRAIFDEKG